MLQILLPENLLSSGPLGQLIDMGGPVMIVLIVMALAGMITFVYLMLYGALFAPRYSRSLRLALKDWKHKPDQSVADHFRRRLKGPGGLNPLHRLSLMTMDGKLRNQPAEQIRETVSQKAQQVLTPFEAPLKIIEVIAALAAWIEFRLRRLQGTMNSVLAEAFAANPTATANDVR